MQYETIKFERSIIQLRTVPDSTARRIVAELAHVEWQQSAVGKRHDVFRVTELVDRSQRNALSVGADRTLATSKSLLRRLGPISSVSVRKHWGVSISEVSAPQFTLYKHGHFISPHRDCGAAYPDRIFSVVTYLNTDYTGGEIVFPGLGTALHPEAGTTLIFPSDATHEVRPVFSGTKMIFLFFLNRSKKDSNRLEE